MSTRATLALPLRYQPDASDDPDRYSLYTDRDGNDVCVAHGPGFRVLVTFDSLVDDISALWATFRAAQSRFRSLSRIAVDFHEHIADMLIDPDDMELWFCDRCDTPTGDEDDRWSINDGEHSYCGTCRQHHTFTCWECEDCYTSTTTVDGDREVCSDCVSNRYTYCDSCEVYYRDGDHDFDHDSGTCSEDCESPAQRFSIRNDGDGLLHNDTRVNVSLPAGVISAEGLNTIRRYLYNQELWHVARFVDQVGEAWQTKEGNYTKRLSRAAYNADKEAGKIPAPVLSHIGVIAREHSRTVDFDLEITRDLNLPASYFAHEESCWWQSYHYSRCTLKTNGGFGLRTFAKGSSHDPYPEGRAWVMPLKHDGTTNGWDKPSLVPTFDAENADAYIVFNGYGNLDGYLPARLLAHMTGGTYRKVGFLIGPMYVNNDSGYLVGPEDLVAAYTDGLLRLGELDQHSDLYDSESADQAALFEKVPAHA